MQWPAIVILFSIHFTAISYQLEARNLNRDSVPAVSRYPYVYSTVPSWFRPPIFDNSASERLSTGSSGRDINWNRRTGSVGSNSRHSINSWNPGTNVGSAVTPHRVYQNLSHQVIVFPRRFDPRPEEMRISNAMLYKQTDGKLLFMGAMNVTTPKPANHAQHNWQRTFQTTTSKPQIHRSDWGGRLRSTTQRSQIDRRYENRRDNLPSQNTRSDRNYLQIQFSAKPPTLRRRESSNSRRWSVHTTPYSFRRARIRHY